MAAVLTVHFVLCAKGDGLPCADVQQIHGCFLSSEVVEVDAICLQGPQSYTHTHVTFTTENLCGVLHKV